MGKGGGGGGKQTTTSKMEPWQAAQGELKNVISEVAKQYEKTGGLDAEWINKNFPDLTPEMQQSLQSLASSGQITNIADQLSGQLSSGTNNMNTAGQAMQDQMNGKYDITADKINELAGQLYDNDTVNSQKQQLADDLQKQYNSSSHSLDQTASQSGNMGSSRAGVAQGVLASNQMTALSKGTADIMNSARTQATQGALGVLGQNQQSQLGGISGLAGLGSNQAQLGAQSASIYQQALQNQYIAAGMTQQQAQAKAENDYYNAYGQANAGWDNLSKYQQMMVQLGGMGGSSTNTASGGGGGVSTGAGILGGAATGAAAGSVAGPWGAAIGGAVGGIAGAFSDATMKKRVQLIGKTKSGDKVYDWEWNEKGKEKGLKGKSSGVLAQNLSKDNPEAVMKQSDGALMVNYNETSVEKPKTKKKKKKTKGA